MSARIEKSEIRKLAIELGFSDCRFTDARLSDKTGANLKSFLQNGYHASMNWMMETQERRKSPEKMWNEAKTAIILVMNYGPDTNPLDDLANKDCGNVSVYARHRDYHDVIKGRLKQIAQKIASRNRSEVKVFVDTAPLMEKPLAQKAGLGWQGKHTNLVSRDFGSWLFIGSILTNEIFEPDPTESDHCGNCTACLTICPTKAFPAPYTLDARRCISYLTIEHDGFIDLEFRKAMGNRIYGCDDCLAICPWNKFASIASEAKLKAREDLRAPGLSFLAGLDDAAFRYLFSGSPIKRIGRNRFLRNVLIAIGNSGNRNLASVLNDALREEDPVLRGAAVWALGEIADHETFNSCKQNYMATETEQSVLAEWERAANQFESMKPNV